MASNAIKYGAGGIGYNNTSATKDKTVNGVLGSANASKNSGVKNVLTDSGTKQKNTGSVNTGASVVNTTDTSNTNDGRYTYDEWSSMYGGNDDSSSSSADAYWEAYLAQQKAAEEAQKKAIQDAVDQSVNTLNAQKTTTSQDYADAYRQLYLNNMQSQKNIGQQMAAQGVTGGASESTLLGLNTNYEDNLRQGKVAEQNALSELDTAIANAKLSGSIEAANNTATNAQNTAQGYLTAWQQQLAAEQAAAQQEQSQASENRSYAYQIAMNMLQNGSMPSETLLKNAGISTADAQTIVAKYVADNASKGSRSSGTTTTTVTKPTAAENKVASNRIKSGSYSSNDLATVMAYTGLTSEADVRAYLGLPSVTSTTTSLVGGKSVGAGTGNEWSTNGTTADYDAIRLSVISMINNGASYEKVRDALEGNDGAYTTGAITKAQKNYLLSLAK